jgi:hypothetical protein
MPSSLHAKFRDGKGSSGGKKNEIFFREATAACSLAVLLSAEPSDDHAVALTSTLKSNALFWGELHRSPVPHGG